MLKSQKWVKGVTLLLALAVVFGAALILKTAAGAASNTVTLFVSSTGDSTTGKDEATAFPTFAAAITYANKLGLGDDQSLRLIVVGDVEITSQNLEGSVQFLSASGKRLPIEITSLADLDEDEFSTIVLAYLNSGYTSGSQMVTFSNDVTLKNIKLYGKDWAEQGHFVSGSTTNYYTIRTLYPAGNNVTLDNVVLGNQSNRATQWSVFASAATALSEEVQTRGTSGVTFKNRNYAADYFPGTSTNRISTIACVGATVENPKMDTYITVGEGATLGIIRLQNSTGSVRTMTVNIDKGGATTGAIYLYNQISSASNNMKFGDEASRKAGSLGLATVNVWGTVGASVVGGGSGNGVQKDYPIDFEVNVYDGGVVTTNVYGLGGFSYADSYGDFTLNLHKGGKIGQDVCGTGNKVNQTTHGTTTLNLAGEVGRHVYGTANPDNTTAFPDTHRVVYGDINFNIMDGANIGTKALSGTASYFYGTYNNDVEGDVNVHVTGGTVNSTTFVATINGTAYYVKNVNVVVDGGTISSTPTSTTEAGQGIFVGPGKTKVKGDVNVTINGGEFISIGGATGAAADMYLLGWDSAVEGNATITVNGGSFTTRDGAGTTGTRSIYVGGHAMKIVGTMTVNVFGGTFDCSSARGSYVIGGRSSGVVFGKYVATIGTADKSTYPTFIPHKLTGTSACSLYLGSYLGQGGYARTATLTTNLPTDDVIRDDVVGEITVNNLEFLGGEGTVYAGPVNTGSASLAARPHIYGSSKVVINDMNTDRPVYLGANSVPMNGNLDVTINGGTFGNNVHCASNSGLISGHVSATLNGGNFAGTFYGGTETAAINNGLDVTIKGCKMTGDKGYYIGSTSGKITLKEDSRYENALEFTMGEMGGDNNKVDIGGSLFVGDYSGVIDGSILANIYSGKQGTSNHMVFGNNTAGANNAAATTNVKGNIIANVYGGIIGSTFLGPRNLNRNVTTPSVEGDVILSIYGGQISSVNKGYSTTGNSRADFAGVAEVYVYTTQNDVAFLNNAYSYTTAAVSSNLSEKFDLYLVPGEYALKYANTGNDRYLAFDAVIGTDASGKADKNAAPTLPIIVQDTGRAWNEGVNYLYLPTEYGADAVAVSTVNGSILSYNGTASLYGNTHSVWVGGSETVPVLNAANLVMDSVTGVQFWFVKADVDAYIAKNGSWTYTITFNGVTETKTITSADELKVKDYDGVDNYVIPMTQGVVATDYGKEISITVSGAAAQTTTVFQLAQTGAEVFTGAEAELFKAIYNYGIAAANTLGTGCDLTPYEGVTYTGTYDAKGSAESLVAGYAYYGASLSLQDVVRVNFYLKLADGFSADQVSFVAKSADGTVLDASQVIVTPMTGSALYDVVVSLAPSIPAMDGVYTVEAVVNGQTVATATHSIASLCAAYIKAQSEYAPVAEALLAYVEAAQAAL